VPNVVRSPIEYPGHFTVKRVTEAGQIFFSRKRKLVYLAKALKQHPVDLEEIAAGVWSIHFCHVRLGHLDEWDDVIRP